MTIKITWKRIRALIIIGILITLGLWINGAEKRDQDAFSRIQQLELQVKSLIAYSHHHKTEPVKQKADESK